MLNVIQISDSHLFADPDERLRGRTTLSTFERAIEHEGDEAPDLPLFTGDVAQDAPAEAYRRAATALRKLGIPCALVPGNHDVSEVLLGRIHRPFQQRRGTTQPLGTPSTCFQFKPKVNTFELDEGLPGYRCLRLHSDGRVETDLRRVRIHLRAETTAMGY